MNSAIFNSAFRTGIWGSQSFLISLGKIFYWNWNFWLAHFGNLFSCSYKNLNLLQKVLLYTPIYALPLKFHLNCCCSLMTSPAEMVWWISSTRKDILASNRNCILIILQKRPVPLSLSSNFCTNFYVGLPVNFHFPGT